jgi:Fe-S-cluster-containing hydrogenase component 2
MNTLYVDKEKCKGCGLCAQQCGFSRVIRVSGGKAAYDNDAGKCGQCFHCLKVCPNNAISYGGDAVVYESGDRASSPVWRRSCRNYLDKDLDRELVTKVINEANTAPRFDIDFSERKFVVVTDKGRLEGVRSTVLAEIGKVRKIFGVLMRIPLLPGKKRKEYAMIADLFGKILEANKTGDSLFHGAPSLVMVAGLQSKTVSPDNSYYALGQLLSIAEEHRLGTCINGFVSFFSKAVAKYIGLDAEYKIYAAAVMGHPGDSFPRTIVRSDSTIEWN